MLSQTRLIHCYDVVSFVTEIEKAIKLGYCLDLKDVQNYPVQIGYQFITTMIRDESAQQKQENTKLEIKIDTTEVKRIVDKAVEEVKSLQEASESKKVGGSTSEVPEAVVEAPKRSPGRPARGS